MSKNGNPICHFHGNLLVVEYNEKIEDKKMHLKQFHKYESITDIQIDYEDGDVSFGMIRPIGHSMMGASYGKTIGFDSRKCFLEFVDTLEKFMKENSSVSKGNGEVYHPNIEKVSKLKGVK